MTMKLILQDNPTDTYTDRYTNRQVKKIQVIGQSRR